MLEDLPSAILLLAHIAVIVGILLVERRQPSATLAWLLTVAFLPGVGLVLYFFIGRMHSRRLAKDTMKTSVLLSALIERLDLRGRMGRAEAVYKDPRTDGLLRLGAKLSSSPASGGNATDILVDGEAIYTAMREAIEEARDHIHVEFYIIRADEVGRAFRDCLLGRAQAGVQVRVICDAAGSHALPGDFWDELRDAGGEARYFRPVSRFFRLRRHLDRIDFRNHRKIVVVDGRVAFTGGLNIGREYLGMDPDFGFWRDTALCMRGPAALSLQVTFVEDWCTVTGQLLDDPRYYPDSMNVGGCVVQVVDSGPDRRWSPIEYVFAQAIASARERLWITSPYFIPSQVIEAALLTAALRGVDVRLLVPKKPDRILVAWAAATYYPSLLAAGVRIYRYDRGFVHAKTLLVDELVGTIGSSNIDLRSFHLNFELNAFVYSANFVNQLASLFESDLEHATEYLQSDVEQRSAPARVASALARLCSPLL